MEQATQPTAAKTLESLVFDAYTIIEKDYDQPQKSRWTKIGVAFENRDGSINIVLDATPVNGMIHIRRRKKGPLKGSN